MLTDLLPFTLGNPISPIEQSRKEALANFTLLLERKESLKAYFLDASGCTDQFSAVPSRQGLELLEDWIVQQGTLVTTKSGLPDRFETREVLTVSVPTGSACCYLALIFADEIQKSVPQTFWTVITDSKRNIDYHQAVLSSPTGLNHLEPRRVVLNSCLSRLKPDHGTRTLGDLYDIWCEKLRQ
jgi:hypothetical protein